MSDSSRKVARRPGFGIGLLKGLAVTFKHLFKHNTVIQYPDVKQELPPRTRGVIALKEENCTVCNLCARECPDWCIYIDSHKETLPPKHEGGRARKRNTLDRFAIDYSLCMYCGICVEVCPYDALFWSPEFEFSEYSITELTHEKEKLSDWMATVLPPPELDTGAAMPDEERVLAAAAARSGDPAAAPEQPTAAPEQPTAAPEQPTAAPAASTSRGAALAASGQDPDAVYERVLAEETAKGSSDRVATARAKAARMRAIKGTAAPGITPPPSAQTSGEEATPPPSASPATPAATAPKPSSAAPEQPVTPVRAREGFPVPPDPGSLVANVRIPAPGPNPPLQVTEDAQAVYDKVLAEQLRRGASPGVAEARARVARLKAEQGIGRGPVAYDEQPPLELSVPATTSEPERQPAPESQPPPEAPARNPEPSTPARAEMPATPAPLAPAPALGPVEGEDPDAAYERVLAQEIAKGSSERVATARAKAARMRAIKGTRGPGG